MQGRMLVTCIGQQKKTIHRTKKRVKYGHRAREREAHLARVRSIHAGVNRLYRLGSGDGFRTPALALSLQAAGQGQGRLVHDVSLGLRLVRGLVPRPARCPGSPVAGANMMDLVLVVASDHDAQAAEAGSVGAGKTNAGSISVGDTDASAIDADAGAIDGDETDASAIDADSGAIGAGDTEAGAIDASAGVGTSAGAVGVGIGVGVSTGVYTADAITGVKNTGSAGDLDVAGEVVSDNDVVGRASSHGDWGLVGADGNWRLLVGSDGGGGGRGVVVVVVEIERRVAGIYSREVAINFDATSLSVVNPAT